MAHGAGALQGQCPEKLKKLEEKLKKLKKLKGDTFRTFKDPVGPAQLMAHLAGALQGQCSEKLKNSRKSLKGLKSLKSLKVIPLRLLRILGALPSSWLMGLGPCKANVVKS